MTRRRRRTTFDEPTRPEISLPSNKVLQRDRELRDSARTRRTTEPMPEALVASLTIACRACE